MCTCLTISGVTVHAVTPSLVCTITPSVVKTTCHTIPEGRSTASQPEWNMEAASGDTWRTKGTLTCNDALWTELQISSGTRDTQLLA